MLTLPFYVPVAQRTEHLSSEQGVGSSILSGDTKCKCGAVKWWSDATWNNTPGGDDMKHICAACGLIWRG